MSEIVKVDVDLDVYQLEDIGKFIVECATKGWQIDNDDMLHIIAQDFEYVRKYHGWNIP